MKHARFLVPVLAASAALFAPRAALAADPSWDAQAQLGRAFDSCDEKNGGGYFSLRDFAFSVDPSLKGWNGSVQRWKKKTPVQEGLARCDKEMAPIVAKAKRDEEIAPLYEALQLACMEPRVDDEAFAKWQAARAAYVAKAGDEDPKGHRARCDREMAKKHDEQKKKDAELAAAKAQNQARAERDAAAAQKRKKVVEAIAAAFTGDRKKVFDRYGWPSGSEGSEETLRRAPVWNYDAYGTIGWVGSVERTGRCTTRFVFQGEKLVKTTQSGPACR